MAHFAGSVELLPQAVGDAFLLSYFQRLPYTEIAGRLGISERTIERHIARALVELNVAMKDFL